MWSQYLLSLIRIPLTTARAFYNGYFNCRLISVHYSKQLWYNWVDFLFANLKALFWCWLVLCHISMVFFWFLSNHKKVLSQCLLHLHAKFYPIPSSGLPCMHDRSLTFLHEKLVITSKCSSDSNKNWCTKFQLDWSMHLYLWPKIWNEK